MQSDTKDFPLNFLDHVGTRARIPAIIVDKIDQDIVVDPVLAQDGIIYSKSNLLKWFLVCESQNLSLCSPYTLKPMSSDLVGCDHLNTKLTSSSSLQTFRRQAMVDADLSVTEKKQTLPMGFIDELLSLNRLAKLHTCVKDVPNLALDDISFGDVPKVAVIGALGCGKSQLLEKLTMYSLFPQGERGEGTRMPILLKMRHVTADQQSPPVLRIIDTSKKVQLGEAVVLPCMDTAHRRIRSIMNDVYATEKRSKRSHRRQTFSLKIESLDSCITEGSNGPNGAACPSDDLESVHSSSSLFSRGTEETHSEADTEDFGVCVDRAIVIHYYSPLVPTIDVVDFPGLLPSFEQNQLWAGTCSRPTEKGDEDFTANDSVEVLEEARKAQWETWRLQRLQLVEMHALAHPKSMYIAAIEANAERLAKSSALDVVTRLKLQEHTLGVITKCDMFMSQCEKGKKDFPISQERKDSSISGSNMPRTQSPRSSPNRAPVTPPSRPETSYTTAYALKWSVLSGDAYTTGVTGVEAPIRLGKGYIFTMIPPEENFSVQDDSELDWRDGEDKSTDRMIAHDNPPCRYSTMICQRLSEPSWFLLNDFEDILAQRRATCGAVVQEVQKMYIEHMRHSWVPNVLKKVLQRKDELLEEVFGLGIPPPPICTRLSSSPFDALGTDNFACISCCDQKAAEAFFSAVSAASKTCIYAGIHSMRTSFVSNVLGPFMSRLCACLPSPDVVVKDCFVPGSSVDAYLSNLRTSLHGLCGTLLSMTEDFWGDAVLEHISSDASPCRLGRFRMPKNSPFYRNDLMSSIKESVKQSVELNSQGLLDELNGCLDDFVCVTSSRGSVTVRYDIDDRKCCKAHVRLNLTDMVHTLIAIATSESRLVTEHALTEAVKDGVVSYMLVNLGQRVPELCVETRQELDSKILMCDSAVKSIIRVLSDDFSGAEYYSSTWGATRPRSVSSGGKRRESKEFVRTLYTGAWGGRRTQKSIEGEEGERIGGDEDECCSSNVDSDEQSHVLTALSRSGLKASCLKNVGFCAKDLRIGGYTAGQLISAGFTIDDIRRGGYALADDKYAGFTLTQLRESGGIALSVLAAQRRVDGATATSMACEGFQFAELQEAGYDVVGALRRGNVDDKLDSLKCVQELAINQDVNELIALGVVGILVDIINFNCGLSEELRIFAAGALGAMAFSSENKVVLAEAGAIPALVGLLESDLDSCKEASAWALRNLAKESSANMIAIARAGAIDPLVDQLLYGTDCYKEAAARALCHLACDNNNISAIASAGAIDPLIDLLEHPEDRFQEAAARALCNLASDESNMKAIASTRTINLLIKLLSSSSDSCKEAAAYALRNIACDEDYVSSICEMGAIKALTVLLCLESEDGKLIEAAASALGGLSCSIEHKIAIGQSGALERLVKIVECFHDRRCEASVWVLGSLISEPSNKIIFAAEGGISALTVQLRKGSDRVKEASAWGFRYLVHGCSDPAIFNACSAAIPPLVRMLSYGDSDGAKEAASWAICSLACDVTCCMNIVDSGALGPLMNILRSGEESCKEAAAFALQNIGPTELRQSGFTVPMLKSAGVALSVLAAQQRVDGATAEKMCRDGFSFEELQEAGYDLLGMVMDGGSAEKIDALKALSLLISADDEMPMAFIADLISGISQLLRYENADVLISMLHFLCIVSKKKKEPILKLTVDTGCVEALSRIIGNEYLNSKCREEAASALEAMLVSPSHKAIAAASGAIPSVRSLICRFPSGSAVDLIRALLTDSSFDLKRDVVNDSECVAVLVDMLYRNKIYANTLEMRVSAASVIKLLSFDNDSKSTLGSAGAILPLVEMLHRPFEGSEEAAVGALRALAWYHNSNTMLILDAGTLDYISKLLYRGSDKCQTESAWLLNSIIGYGCNLVIEAGCLEPLVSLMRSHHESTCEAAVCAIGNLVKSDPDQVSIVLELGGIESIAGLFRNGSKTCKMAAACCLNGLWGINGVSIIMESLGVTKEAIIARMSGG